MSRGAGRADRLRRLEQQYLIGAYTDEEMADLLGVGSRTTIFKDRQLLTEEGVPFEEVERGRYTIDRTRYLSSVRLNLNEAGMLYLLARRAARQTRRPNRHVTSLLEKIAGVLRPDALTDQLLHATQQMPASATDDLLTQTLEKVVRCWVQGHKISINYQALHANAPRLHLVSPYLIEPSLVDDGIYLIGYSETLHKSGAFKLARITQAATTAQPIIPPPTDDVGVLLREAWGVWQAAAPVTVQLRFYGEAVVRRVRETVWHPNETLTVEADDRCLWSAEVSEWREMLPWVRGWGADVAVVAPAEMRKRIARDARGLAKIYAAKTMAKPAHHLVYAKTARDSDDIHLLLFHLIDVGQVALVLWEKVLSTGVRARLATMLNCDVAAAGRIIAFCAALHDLGKAGPAYQKKYAPGWLLRELAQAELPVDHPAYSHAARTLPHGLVTAWALPPLLVEAGLMSERFAREVAAAVGGHHGSWPPAGATDGIDDSAFPAWQVVREDLFWELRAVFSPQSVERPNKQQDINAFLTTLSGLTSVADWLGSREEYFPLRSEPQSTRRYAADAAQAARWALKDLGWIGWQPDGDLRTFAELFAHRALRTPRTLQQEVVTFASKIAEPSLLIVEAPTGIGKTEAALHVADHWLQQLDGRGLYIAMPTQATSNQMYGRTVEFLAARYPHTLVNVPLAHSQSRYSDQMSQIALHTIGEDDGGRVVAMSWFVEKSKRTLLAPFGVGTVDQTLLSVLQANHFFVRLFGLNRKVVIFDEVHAYDAFMLEIFTRLLNWLQALDCPVIILSATLPAAVRRRLVTAYTGVNEPTQAQQAVHYPRATLASSTGVRSYSLTPPPTIAIGLSWLPEHTAETVAAHVLASLADGGCAAIICNTVGRAQQIYAAFEAQCRQMGATIDLCLFHARMPAAWRRETEQAVLSRYGPDGTRPARAVVVATQVIEQSLDLDFDLLVSELAPIDLLIQRAGRLHRHERGARDHARTLLLVPPASSIDGQPAFGSDAHVYEPYLLLKTYHLLRERESLHLPVETPDLVEAVYAGSVDEQMGDTPDADGLHLQLYATYRKLVADTKASARKAAAQLIPQPDSRRLLMRAGLGLEEDDPTVHRAMRAMTRDMDAGIALVCLVQIDGHISPVTDTAVVLDLQTAPDDRAGRALADATVNVQSGDVVEHFLAESAPAGWRRNPVLRHARACLFTDNNYTFTTPRQRITLTLTRELGLQITREVL